MSSTAFGRTVRGEWLLDEKISYLNHGTVGVTPRAVLAAQTALRDRIERQPAKFMLREYKDLLRKAADSAAETFGGRGRDYVFTDNATAGINAVLRSLALKEGDEVLVTDHTYGAIRNAAAYACRRSGARLVVAAIPFPSAGPDEIIAVLTKALSERTRLAVLDHITSETALVLPLKAMIALSHDAGARVVVDGAHAPGVLDLDIPALGADWYAANLHKWYFAPRGCGLLWASEAAQEDLHPAAISWRLDEGFTAEFDWNGTRDPTPFLCFPDGKAFMDGLGVENVRTYNHELVVEGAGLLFERFGGNLALSQELTGSMALAPLPASLPTGKPQADAVRDALLFQHDIEVPVIGWAGRLWARTAAQVYCERADFGRLVAAVETIAAKQTA